MTSKRLSTLCLYAIVAIIAISFFNVAVTASDDYDVSSLILPSSNSFFSNVGVTGQRDTVAFTFLTTTQINGGSNSHFRATFPVGYTKVSSSSRCVISHSKGTIQGTVDDVAVVEWYNNQLTLRCNFAAGLLRLEANVAVSITFTGMSYTASSQSDLCIRSFRPSSTPLDILFNLLDPTVVNSNNILVGSADSCCTGSTLFYYSSAQTMATYAAVKQCALPSTSTSTSAATVKLYDLSLSSTTSIASSKTTVTASFTTGAALKSSDRTGLANEIVPSYLWVHLPHFRASKNIVTGDWLQQQFGITCNIKVDGALYKPVTTERSPAVVIRPIDSNDQSAGIVVQCALGGDAISAEAKIEIVVVGVYSPPASQEICTAYGLQSTNSACCDSIHISYHYGNSVNDVVIFQSADAYICPAWVADQSTANIILTKVISADVRFTPTQVSADVALSTAQYIFTPTIAIASGAAFTFNLPGFKLADNNLQSDILAGKSVNTKLRIAAAGSSSATDIPVVAFAAGGVLIFKGPFSIALAAAVQVSIFLPPIIPTHSLPSYNQCYGSLLSGTATTDALCCSEFKIEISIGGIVFTAITTTCPALPGNPVIECENPLTWGYTKCCAFRNTRIQLSDAALEKCYDYSCNPPRFNVYECCTHNEYRSDARCCENAYFCPNHCCGQKMPFVNHVPYFSFERCCEPEVIANITHTVPEIEQVCTCWADELNEDFDDLHNGHCCLEMKSNGFDITTPFCQCDELYTLLQAATNATNSTAVQAAIIDKYIASHPNFALDYCCSLDLTIDYWPETDYCQCLESSGTVADFNTDDCCAFSQFSSKPICDIKPVCPPLTGCCNICDKQLIDISDITSKDDTIIKIHRGPTPCCGGCNAGS